MALAAAAAILAIAGTAQAADDPAIVPEIEENDVATLPAAGAHWAFVGDAVRGGVRIVDGDTGRFIGGIYTGQFADFALDPLGRSFYVAETIWTRGNRGKRQDLLTVYDPHSLKIVAEIEIPGRLLIGSRALNLGIAPDGRHAFVYNLDPASSIEVIDLVTRRFVGAVELPGCALAIAAGNATNALCSDGTMATVTYDARMQGKVERSPVFFSAEEDPIFDNSFVDRRTGKAIFMTYSGLLHEANLGARPAIAAPWSLQQAAGLPAGSTAPLATGWFPGGRQPIAFNRATGRAYVLMHMGEFWSHKQAGSELWEIDLAARRVLRRRRLDDPAAAVAVSQDAGALLFLVDENDRLHVIDATSFEEKRSLANVGNDNIAATGN